jgi:hypothetical protein
LLFRFGHYFVAFMIRKPVHDLFLNLVVGALFAATIFLFTNQVIVDSGQVGAGGAIADDIHEISGRTVIKMASRPPPALPQLHKRDRLSWQCCSTRP